jgi:hypothetical protein
VYSELRHKELRRLDEVRSRFLALVSTSFERPPQ